MTKLGFLATMRDEIALKIKQNISSKKKRLTLTQGYLVENEEIEDKGRDSSRTRFWETVSLATEFGFQIAIPISLGALLGVWLDAKFATQPKLTLSFLFLGLIFSFYSLVSVVKKFSKKR